MGGAFFLRTHGDEVVHLLVDIHRIDATAGANGLGEAERKVSAARAQVRDAIAGADLECRDDLFGLLPFVAVEPLIGALLEGGATGQKQ